MAGAALVASLLAELRSTEEHFVEDLRIIANVYLRPLRDGKVVAREEIVLLFGNVESLLQAHEALAQMGAAKRALEEKAAAAEAITPMPPSPTSSSHLMPPPQGLGGRGLGALHAPADASGVREALLPRACDALLPRCSEASSERIGTPEVGPVAAHADDEE